MRKNVRFVHQNIVDFRSNSRKNSRNLHTRIDILLSTVFSVFSLRLIHVLSTCVRKSGLDVYSEFSLKGTSNIRTIDHSQLAV